MKNFFITGTDTGVGKTVVSAVLVHALQAYYWKPIQTGLANDLSEQQIVQRLTGLADNYFLPSVHALQAGLAIDQAAKLENISIELSQFNLPTLSRSLIVEGAGGVFHPLNATTMMFDLIKKFNLPVIIVCRGTLGTINHTLLTIEALRHRGIPLKGVIFSGELNLRNQATIEQRGKILSLIHIPQFEDLTSFTLQKWANTHRPLILEKLI
ncbi:MAG: bioD [Gammaproteobacteria bacterium]|jgi:dethiobiotin synthase|nr:bioD [Gammaproteobacteria bacterium]